MARPLQRLLALANAKVDVVLFGRIKDTKGDAQSNFEKVKSAAGGASTRFFECDSSDEWDRLTRNELSKSYSIVVDALFGDRIDSAVGRGLWRSR